MLIDDEPLPLPVRTAVSECTGEVRSAESAGAGTNCVVAALLDTASGPVFLKGLPSGHPGVATQQKEANIAPAVAEVSPRLLWRIEAGGWDLLGFEVIEGGSARRLRPRIARCAHGAQPAGPAVGHLLPPAGHTPAGAERWAEKSVAWQEADQEAVTLFSGAVARLLRKLADDDPTGDWRRPLVEAAAAWAAYRGAAV